MKNVLEVWWILGMLGLSVIFQGCFTISYPADVTYDRGELTPIRSTETERAWQSDDTYSPAQAVHVTHKGGAFAFQEMVYQKAQAYGIDYYLMLAIIQAESGGNPRAKSPANCYGLTQLHINTARQYLNSITPEQLYDPQTNLEIASRHMAYLRELVHTHFPQADLLTRVTLLSAAWNAGWGRVKRTGGVPDIGETRRFTQRVLSLYQQYRWG